MFVDARSVPAGTTIETEVCIVGGGAAGITLAREFINSGFRVALLESGDIDFNDTTQDLYGGRNVGRRYFDPKDIGLRLRFFGGTTNHWGGWCALPDRLDFEVRENLKYSGWPFSRDYLIPWYQRAHGVLQLGPFDYELADWGISSSEIPQPFNGPHFVCQVLQVSPPTRFGPEYGPELRQAARVVVYLNANALQFDATDNNNSVQQLNVGVISDQRFVVRAKVYILATGGIENARLLLLSGVNNRGLGNEHDLVGRFFMVHVEYQGGAIIFADSNMDFRFHTGDEGAFYNRSGVLQKFVSYICLSEQSRRKLRLPNLRMVLSKSLTSGSIERHDRFALEGMGLALRDMESGGAKFEKVQFESPPFSVMTVHCSSEQMPNPDSRISLGDGADAFGLRDVSINWQLTVDDKRGVYAGHRLLGAEIGRARLGRFWSSVSADDVTWPRRMFGNQHNIGTTRMHREPRSGVVNENCRVHGVTNLYVAGSSVFPTEGTANPTLTIVALALRLADHIKERLQ